MGKSDDIQHSILIISSSEQFDSLIRHSLTPGRFSAIETIRNASSARRWILERYCDIVAINAPLVDEMGVELAADIAQKMSACILLVVPKEIYEDVSDRMTDMGIYVVPKPFPKGRLDKAVRFVISISDRLRKLESQITKTEDKLEELRIVSKTKLLLVEREHMSEDDAHRLIGKIAMDNGISRGRAAQRLMEDME